MHRYAGCADPWTLPIPAADRASRAVAMERSRRAGDGHTAESPDSPGAVARCRLPHHADRQMASRLSAALSPLKSGYDEFFGIMGGYTGYYTHLGDGGAPDLSEGETPVKRQGYVTDMLSERAVAFVEAAAAPQPYFLSLHYTAPHWPSSSPSVEAAPSQREVDRAGLSEGGSAAMHGQMVPI